MIVPAAFTQEIIQLKGRLERTEEALLQTVDALQSVIESLESRFGPGLTSNNLRQLQPQNADIEQLISQIDELVRTNQSGAAARTLRQSLHCTWDEAHDGIRRWKQHSLRQKQRWLRLAWYIRSPEDGDNQST